MNGSTSVFSQIVSFLPFLLASSPFLALGIYLLVTAAKTKKHIKNNCFTPVEAECIAHETESIRAKGLVYQRVKPVYHFTYNGMEYTVKDEVTSGTGFINRYLQAAAGSASKPGDGIVPEVGETKTIYIDENDLTKYADQTESGRARTGLYIFALIAFGAVVLLFFMFGMDVKVASWFHPVGK